MKKIKLHDGKGAYVREVEIPKYSKQPRVICWAGRFFLLDGEYSEVVCHFVTGQTVGK